MSPGLTINEAAELFYRLCEQVTAGERRQIEKQLGDAVRSSALTLELALKVLGQVSPNPAEDTEEYCVRCRGIYSHRYDCEFVGG